MTNTTDPRTPQERDLDAWQAEWRDTYRSLLEDTRCNAAYTVNFSTLLYPTLLDKENMMTVNFEIPAEFQEKLKNAMKDESGVRLPFAAPTMWWMNGKPALRSVKEINNPTRFGGWGISKDEIDDFGSDLAEIPPHWELHDSLANNEGGTYAAYLTRQAWVAPIARRYTWIENKSRTQYLCYLGVMTQQKVILPHFPVVIQAKSTIGIDLDKCFKTFASQTTQLRGKTSANFFWHPVGTWEAEPVLEERKSKGGRGSSMVTPPQLWIPKDGYTAEHLEKQFVGIEVAQEMAHLLDQAKEWLDDWKQQRKAKPEAEPNPFGEAPEPELNQDDVFPF